MPELPRALQQQRTLLIYIEEPAVQGRGLQLHPDRLAERHRPCQPSRAYRSEAVLTPTPLPSVEISGELLERVRRGERPPTLFGDRGGRKLGSLRRRGEIDADAEDDKLRDLPLAQVRLKQNPGDLAALYEHVVRPFVGHPLKPLAGRA